ncbi:MAG: hypothetical protein M1829_005302 [Trizodia sp. TS-e1964]|nr:MAG: hypothetical protein M1829_005302 [Trizodia sp. TS-e1964]
MKPLHWQRNLPRTRPSFKPRLLNTENDNIILIPKAYEGTNRSAPSKKLFKLLPGRTFSSHRGNIDHNSIIGKRFRDLVKSHKGFEFRIHQPTLAEYITLSRRIVTPIYPTDANLLVSALDIHVTPPTSENNNNPPLEILEAGTGHGGLTLHLARAIHAANTSAPIVAPMLDTTGPNTTSVNLTHSGSKYKQDNSYHDSPEVRSYENAFNLWKSSRGAIVHTVDLSVLHTERAKSIVRGFRNGIYANNVEFYTDEVSSWIKNQFNQRQNASGSHPVDTFLNPFLTHVILDLPNPEQQLLTIAPAILTNGTLSIFNPQISQIWACVEVIKKLRLPFVLEKVVELGNGDREWDIRAVRPRSHLGLETNTGLTPQPVNDNLGADDDNEARGGLFSACSKVPQPHLELTQHHPDEAGWEIVCRPKVGVRVVGGGFLGRWRKMRPAESIELDLASE